MSFTSLKKLFELSKFRKNCRYPWISLPFKKGSKYFCIKRYHWKHLWAVIALTFRWHALKNKNSKNFTQYCCSTLMNLIPAFLKWSIYIFWQWLAKGAIVINLVQAGAHQVMGSWFRGIPELLEAVCRLLGLIVKRTITLKNSLNMSQIPKITPGHW